MVEPHRQHRELDRSQLLELRQPGDRILVVQPLSWRTGPHQAGQRGGRHGEDDILVPYVHRPRATRSRGRAELQLADPATPSDEAGDLGAELDRPA